MSTIIEAGEVWEDFVKSCSDLELVSLRFLLKKTQPDDKEHLKIVEDELKRRAK